MVSRSYGLTVNVSVGFLYEPYLWFDLATLNVPTSLALALSLEGILTSTVSPTWNVPEIMLISINFGIAYFDISTPAKNGYNRVNGLLFLEVNSIFLLLINGITSVLTTEFPCE